MADYNFNCNFIDYSFNYSYNEKVHTSRYQLHTHDEYEIFFFLEGDAHYVVEGKNYSLEPCDIIVIRRHEMHRIFHHTTNCLYSRCVLMVAPEFFKNHSCPEYEKQFADVYEGVGNKISSDVVRSSGLYDAFHRLKKYSDNFKSFDSPVCSAIVIEILHLINEVTLFAHDDIPNNQIKEIMAYINNNYTHNLTLELIAEKFFLSKYYLCHMFKKATGLSVHRYITQKRITKARELIAEGVNITSAVVTSGFNNYSTFYRAYLREYSVPPRNGTKI